MIHALRSTGRTPSFRPSSSQLLPSRTTAATSRVRFAQSSADKHPSEEDMDKDQKLHEETRDVMSQSFGEAYATRSDEEGFGGIYGGKQSLSGTGEEKEDDKKKIIHENHPEYDKSQGSEVKEKEKARHQIHVSTPTP